MPRPRMPTGVAKVVGADKRSPGRFKDRQEIKSAPLGTAPRKFDDELRAIWNIFADEMPWLSKSDRAVTEIATRLRWGMENDPGFPMAGYVQLRLCLSVMGGTPADRSKVGATDDGDNGDPLEQFFN